MKTKYFPFILFLVFLCAIGCHRKKAVSEVQTSLPLPVSSYFSEEDKLIFIGVKCIGDEAFIIEKMELLGKKVVVGKMKTDEQSENQTAGAVRIALLDQNGQILGTNIFPNPLSRTVEYADSDGNLKSRFVQARELESTYRIMYIPGAMSFEIQVLDSEGKAKTLLKDRLLD